MSRLSSLLNSANAEWGSRPFTFQLLKQAVAHLGDAPSGLGSQHLKSLLNSMQGDGLRNRMAMYLFFRHLIQILPEEPTDSTTPGRFVSLAHSAGNEWGGGNNVAKFLREFVKYMPPEKDIHDDPR